MSDQDFPEPGETSSWEADALHWLERLVLAAPVGLWWNGYVSFEGVVVVYLSLIAFLAFEERHD